MDASHSIPGPLVPRVAAAGAAPVQTGREPPAAPRADVKTGTDAGAGRSAAAAPVVEQTAEAEDALGLTAEEQTLRDRMAARDREVRAHENAHVVVGGPYAGRPSYELEMGPDGRRYATGGEVPIDAAPIKGDPEGTVVKMTIVEAAALAPPEPSATDRAVAALARAQALQAEAEIAALRRAAAGAPEEGVSVRL